ncbi:unnamed protein product [Arabidopsis halleri]
MDQFVIDAAYGCFMRTANPFFDWRPLRYPHNLTRSLPEGITRKELGIINLTAQFMAVFGIFFQRALIKTQVLFLLSSLSWVPGCIKALPRPD